MSLPRPIRPQYQPTQEELDAKNIQNKREIVHRFAEIILMNDEGNTMPIERVAARALDLYNIIEKYL